MNNLYSFLENLNPETGHVSRKAYYKNQKGIDINGKNVNVLSANFTYDKTAAKK